MNSIEYGSIQVKSFSMLNILKSLHDISESELIFIVGEKGTGKTFLANHIQNHVLKNPNLIVSDSYQTRSLNGIFTLTTNEWNEVSAKIKVSYRLIKMPSLCDRKADLALLAEFFLQVLSLMNNKPKVKLTEKALEKILQYGWPGQFYEFESVLEEALLLAENSNLIEPQFLQMGPATIEVGVPTGMKLEELERKYILQTLYFVHQNRTKAAEILGISIRTLRNKINQYRTEGYL
ncbi:MAG: hypothetical protein A2622_09025 [Bdellovibrionales bacterium RIFCSPHIGHO2_01_FULL_40_29]|nr:MAG: hypothetical protein A2622_09025 [Bdellovibrionales bacterium RIFCSPHIGHO2_01_FULL_40_29]OFZ32875.1 MAG: hypothetical protein A3D17_09235 [Bdellovibrionales bacterium RIFCSPHIGHO2_02_FULL_40_15]